MGSSSRRLFCERRESSASFDPIARAALSIHSVLQTVTHSLRSEPVLGATPELEAARTGDRAAQARLLRAALPRLRNLIRYLVRHDAEVDDIAQEAMVSIVRGLPSYRGEGTFQSWCDRITAREALKQRRKQQAQRAEEADALDESAPLPSPEAWLERRRAVALLDQLPEAQRDAVVLHHLGGFSLPELADELHIPVETARSRLRLGMQKLRAQAGVSTPEEERP